MKITFVGGGSLVWGTMLLTDLALNPTLHGSTIMLQDVDRSALDLMLAMGRLISERAGAAFRMEAALDLAEAAHGAWRRETGQHRTRPRSGRGCH